MTHLSRRPPRSPQLMSTSERSADPLAVAAEVITASDAARPADAVLRARLGRERGLDPATARAISQAVFRYFRWFGWLDQNRPLRQNVQFAQDLQKEFERRPQKVSNEALVAKAVPGWITGEVEVTPEWVRSLQMEPTLWLRARQNALGGLILVL